MAAEIAMTQIIVEVCAVDSVIESMAFTGDK